MLDLYLFAYFFLQGGGDHAKKIIFLFEEGVLKVFLGGRRKKMKGKRRILAITLLVSILIGLVPTGSNHVYASDWEECSFCDHNHSDDYLCDGCGGCNENCDSDCYISNHCHSCGECFDNVLICEGCWTCENCVKICPDCHYCEDNCNSFGIEFCPGCDKCFLAMVGGKLYLL